MVTIKNNIITILAGLVLISAGLGYLFYHNPVTGDPVEISNPDMYSDTEYTGDVKVYNLVQGNNHVNLKFNEDFRNVKYNLDVYYVNHTGVDAEGFGAGGSSTVEDSHSFNDNWSQESDPYTREYELDRNYAFALVDVRVENETLAEGIGEGNFLSFLSFILVPIGIGVLLIPILADVDD